MICFIGMFHQHKFVDILCTVKATCVYTA